jgi:purine-binding chemotaxis protein CheW
MPSLYLLARIADETIALPADRIGSVVEVEEIAAVPRVPTHVAGLFALRSRVLTVIDTRASLQMGAIEQAGTLTAVIVDVDGHSYALLVDEVEDVIEAGSPEACPALLSGAWRRAARGTIRHGDQAILVIDPVMIVAGPEQVAA